MKSPAPSAANPPDNGAPSPTADAGGLTAAGWDYPATPTKRRKCIVRPTHHPLHHDSSTEPPRRFILRSAH